MELASSVSALNHIMYYAFLPSHVYPRVIMAPSARSCFINHCRSEIVTVISSHPLLPHIPSDSVTLYRDITSGRLIGLASNAFHVYLTPRAAV